MTTPTYRQDPVTGQWFMLNRQTGEWLPVVSSQEDPRAAVSMRDPAEFQHQRDPRSSDDFLRAEFQTPPDQRQMARRLRQLNESAEELVRNMVAPVKGPEFRSISDEAYLELMRHQEAWASEGFKPVAAYFHQIHREGHNALRPLYQGEVGIVEKYDPRTEALVESYILVLESGKMAGQWTGIDAGGKATPQGGVIVDEHGRPVHPYQGSQGSETLPAPPDSGEQDVEVFPRGGFTQEQVAALFAAGKITEEEGWRMLGRKKS